MINNIQKFETYSRRCRLLRRLLKAEAELVSTKLAGATTDDVFLRGMITPELPGKLPRKQQCRNGADKRICLGAELAKGSDVTQVLVRLPNGERKERRFCATEVRLAASTMDLLSSSTRVSLEQMMAPFNQRIAELQQLMVARGVNTTNDLEGLAALDKTVASLEEQLGDMMARVDRRAELIPKIRAFIELTSQQQKKFQQTQSKLPANLPGADPLHSDMSHTPSPNLRAHENGNGLASQSSDGTPAIKEKKKANPPPKWYVTPDEFGKLSSYMKGRLTIDKVNGAVDEMCGFAEANMKLLRTKRQKIGDDLIDRVLELREISLHESVKGKFFFLESDLRGHLLKPDITGKAILTILRHLGRIGESRIGKQRVLTLNRPS
ncbi:hypothetical protein R1sor_020143 [Riccia sorocarpa]|uniref:SKA complex subunit 1 homolog n=1 Tax=Riccia sorocarpa TaxID=122646 RepID=A0ABD3IFN3_9MARC